MAQDVKQVGAFHKNHGANIHLLEEGTVAHRKDSYNKAVVFTEYPINIGGLFEVKIEDIGGGWAGSLRIGMTVECPDEIKVPLGALDLYKSGNYWILSASTVHHQGREKKVEFNVEELKVGDTVGCSIHEDGTLHYYVNGKDRGVSWNDKLPTNHAMYGFADVYGAVRKIRSLFHYDERMSCEEDIDILDVTG